MKEDPDKIMPTDEALVRSADEFNQLYSQYKRAGYELLAAVVAGMLVLTLGRGALLGLLCSGVTLLTATVALLPGSLSQFIHDMPINLQRMQETIPYLWERHVTGLAFWRLLIQGNGVGPTHSFAQMLAIQCSLILGGVLVLATWRRRSMPDHLSSLTRFDRRQRRQLYLDRTITATILAMPLMMPFYFGYDLLLLAIPAVLMTRGVLLRRAAGEDVSAEIKLNARLWTILFLCLMIAAPLATLTRVNIAVIAVGLLAAVAIGRCWRPMTTAQPMARPVAPLAVTVRRAA